MPFAKLGLTKPLLRGVQSMGNGVTTPIQLRAIPPTLQGRDLIASVQTAGINQVINYDPPQNPWITCIG
jgi:superfamily II DNA/RNA helicase